MTKFLTGNELNSEIEKLFEKAEDQIILISPYIKLHDRYISALKTKKENPNIQIIVVFGKNEEDYSKSMSEEDFNFLKEFPNIEIHYEKRLHAKYYCNESTAILTSMNLYNFSQDNNIEVGIMTKLNLFKTIANNVISGEDNFNVAAVVYFNRVIEQSELLFKKDPVYDNASLGLKKKYITSNTVVDNLSKFFALRMKNEINRPQEYNKKQYANYEQNNNQIKIKPNADNDTNSTSSNIKFLSTSELSKELGLSRKDLFSKFLKLQWIEKKDGEWILTNIGKKKGGHTRNGQYGEYIAWPNTIINEIK